MPIYRFGDKVPRIHPTAYIADTAVVIGDVEIGAHASVWFNTVIRGDNARIIIGENSNIQDGSILHTSPAYPLTIGKNVTVGHMVMLHGCTIEDGALVGMRAMVLNGSVIPADSFVGAGAFVAENKHYKPNAILIGAPARTAGTITEDKIRRMAFAANHYVENGARYREMLEEISRTGAILPEDK